MSLHAQSLALGAADYTWRNEALCRDTDPELFFPVGNTGDAIGQIELARTVCNDCQVRSQCLEFALATNQDCGVWGGTSEDERRRIRRERAAMRRMGHPAGA
jgi:WhiB family redox-sensing transcriptional regulator